MEYLPRVHKNISPNWGAKILYGAFYIYRDQSSACIEDVWKVVYGDKSYYVSVLHNRHKECVECWHNGVKLSAAETEKLTRPEMYKEVIWILPQPIAEEIWGVFRVF